MAEAAAACALVLNAGSSGVVDHDGPIATRSIYRFPTSIFKSPQGCWNAQAVFVVLLRVSVRRPYWLVLISCECRSSWVGLLTSLACSGQSLSSSSGTHTVTPRVLQSHCLERAGFLVLANWNGSKAPEVVELDLLQKILRKKLRTISWKYFLCEFSGCCFQGQLPLLEDPSEEQGATRKHHGEYTNRVSARITVRNFSQFCAW